MNVQKEDLQDAMVKFTIELSEQELAPYLDRAAARISKNLKVSGFRSGHMPREVVEKQVGAMGVLEEAVQIAIPKELGRALDEQGINAVGEPKFGVEKLAPGNPVVFTAEVAVLPNITLPDLKSLKVKRDEPKVTDEKIEETLKVLQEQRAAFNKVERAAKEGDQVLIDFVGRQDGAKVEGAEGEKHPLELGSGQFIPGFEEAVVGMKADEEKEFDVTFPKDYHKKELANANVTFKVKAHEVSEKSVKEINDDFAKELGDFKTLDELKQKLRENLLEEMQEEAKQKFDQDVIDAIVEKLGDVKLPQVVIDSELNRMFNEIKQRIEMQGGTVEQYLESIGKSEEEFQKENKETAYKRAMANLVVYQAAKDNQTEVSDEELQEEHQEAINKYQFNPQVLDHVKSDDYKAYLKTVLENRKTIEWLVEQVGGTEAKKEENAS